MVNTAHPVQMWNTSQQNLGQMWELVGIDDETFLQLLKSLPQYQCMIFLTWI